MPEKRNRSASRPKKVISATLSSAIDDCKVSAAVAKPASEKLAVPKLRTVDGDCLFSYGPVTHYFHTVTSRGIRQALSRPEGTESNSRIVQTCNRRKHLSATTDRMRSGDSSAADTPIFPRGFR